jgi:hypothetical protein
MKPTRAMTVVPMESGTVEEPRTRAVSREVRGVMQDLLVAWPPPAGEDHADRVRLVEIWVRVTSVFEQEVISEALHDLLTNNPRNPFRPSVQDIVERCQCVRAQWADCARAYYLGRADAPPPGWSSHITREVLRSILQELQHECAQPRNGVTSCPGFTDAELRGWRMARRIGPRISEWPTELLTEFGVAPRDEVDRVQAFVDAENARLEKGRQADRNADDEAVKSAMKRPDVIRAFEAKRAAERHGPNSDEARQAHQSFTDLYLRAHAEELMIWRGCAP